jgi:hypothetical protein
MNAEALTWMQEPPNVFIIKPKKLIKQGKNCGWKNFKDLFETQNIKNLPIISEWFF